MANISNIPETEDSIGQTRLISMSGLMKFYGANHQSQITERMRKMRIKGFFRTTIKNGKPKKEKWYSLDRIEAFINR